MLSVAWTRTDLPPGLFFIYTNLVSLLKDFRECMLPMNLGFQTLFILLWVWGWFFIIIHRSLCKCLFLLLKEKWIVIFIVAKHLLNKWTFIHWLSIYLAFLYVFLRQAIPYCKAPSVVVEIAHKRVFNLTHVIFRSGLILTTDPRGYLHKANILPQSLCLQVNRSSRPNPENQINRKPDDGRSF